jgi:heme-degrading monooxygenase HmoA
LRAWNLCSTLGACNGAEESGMGTNHVIFRKWTGRIRTAQQEEYVQYIAGTGLDDYARTPGNLGFEMLLRDLGNGETEVSTLSWWESMDAIRAFAGDPPELARYYPEDDRFLVHRPLHVEHHRVVASELRVPHIDPSVRR